MGDGFGFLLVFLGEGFEGLFALLGGEVEVGEFVRVEAHGFGGELVLEVAILQVFEGLLLFRGEGG